MAEGIRIDPVGSANVGAAQVINVNTGKKSLGNFENAINNGNAENIDNSEVEQGANINRTAAIDLNNAEAVRAALKNAPIDILQKALRDADVQITQDTLDIVKSLINGSIPLTNKNIVDLLLQTRVFKNADSDTLALMMRLEIPATEENVAQFANLINNNAKLSENLENIINKLPSQIFNSAKTSEEIAHILNETVNIVLNKNVNLQNGNNNIKNPQNQFNNLFKIAQELESQSNYVTQNSDLNNNVNANEKNQFSQLNNLNNFSQVKSTNLNSGENINQQNRPVLNRIELNNILNILKNLNISETNLNKIININRQNSDYMKNLNNSKSGETRQSRQLNQLNQFSELSLVRNQEKILDILNKFASEIASRPQIKGSPSEKMVFENLKNLMESGGVQKLIKFELFENWFLNPKKIENMANSVDKELPKFYNKLNENLNKFAHVLNFANANNLNNIENKSSLIYQSKSAADSLNLMNDINKNMPFAQIPLKFSSGETANSDLYIFKNKRKKIAPNKSVSALIKLELENLGGIDIYVSMSGKNARIKFFSENDAAVGTISENLPDLGAALAKIGVNFSGISENLRNGNQEFDILDDFINRETPKTEIRKYILKRKI